MSREISFVTNLGLPRVPAAILALTFPGVLIGLSIGAGFRRGGGAAELGMAFVGALAFLIAAPTTWIFSITSIEVERFTLMTFGVLTSLPLWALTGVFLARLSPDWATWTRWYGAACATWIAISLVMVGVLSELVV